MTTSKTSNLLAALALSAAAGTLASAGSHYSAPVTITVTFNGDPSLGSISGWQVTGAMATARSSADNVAWLECNDYAYRGSSIHYGVCYGRDSSGQSVSCVTQEP